MNIFELANETVTEEKSIELAIRLGLIATKEKNCQKCNGKMIIEKGKVRHGINKRYRCLKKTCRASISFIKGSIFDGVRLQISKVIKLIYFYSLNFKISACVNHIGISKPTCVKWYKKFRRICEGYQLSLSERKIGGHNCVVEVDETYVSKRKYNTGRVLASQSVWLVGGICRETNEVFLKFVERRNYENLCRILLESVNPGTKIITDCWRGYRDLSNIGFIHETVNHTFNFVSPSDPTVHTQRVERLWRTIKSFIPRNTRKEFLNSYGDAYLVDRKISENGNLVRFYNFVNIIKIFYN